MLKLENYMDLLELGNILMSNAIGRTPGFPEFDDAAKKFITRYQELPECGLVLRPSGRG